jgi:hypothetical protein
MFRITSTDIDLNCNNRDNITGSDNMSAASDSCATSRNKNGQFCRKGYRKKLSALGRGLSVRVATTKGEPAPVFNKFEDDRGSECDPDVQENVHIDHDYLGLQEEVTVGHVTRQFDDVHPSSDDGQIEWRVGRRIVNLGVLADGLRACQLCQLPLHLHNCVQEKKVGLSQILGIKCDNCQLVNNVPTGNRHRTDRGGLAWDANTKLAAGKLECMSDIIPF